MFSPEEYRTGWLVYAGVFCVFNLAWWFLTARVSLAELRQLLRLLVCVGLAVPWYTELDSIYLAPAWIIAATDLLFDSKEAFWRAGTPLLFALALALCVVTLLKIVGYFTQRNHYED